ncbi:hypothetical protein T11_2064, partial [Trichinella zimbabwensis]
LFPFLSFSNFRRVLSFLGFQGFDDFILFFFIFGSRGLFTVLEGFLRILSFKRYCFKLFGVP